MKQLLITIAAVVLVGCGAKPNYSGVYTLDIDSLGTFLLELKPDSSFIGTPQGEEDDRGIGSWKVEGDLFVCEGTTEKSSQKIVLKLNKTTLELTSITVDGEDRRPPVPEGADGHYFKRSAPSSETEPVESVAEAAKVEPSTAKAPDIDIYEAAMLGNIEAVKQHIVAGTDVNATDEDGVTPLEVAAAGGHKELAELLIAKGADVNAKDHHGSTPLVHAVVLEYKEIAELLIAKGADVNAKTESGSTLLHEAVFWGDKEITQLLIAKGASVNAKDVLDETPLDKAIKRKHPETADLLRKHGGKTSEELKAEGK